MPETNLSALWEKAIDRFQAENKIDLSQSIPNSSLSTAEIMDEVERAQKSFSKYRSKGNKLRDALKLVSTPVKLMAEAVSHSVKTVIPPAEAVSAVIIVLLKAADGVSARYDAIVEMLESLANFLGRLNCYLSGPITESMEKVIIETLAQVLVVLGLCTKAIKQKRPVAYFKTLIGKNSEIDIAMDKLKKLSSQEEEAISTATFSATQSILVQLEHKIQADEHYSSTIAKMLEKIVQAVNDSLAKSERSQQVLENIEKKITNYQKEQMDRLAMRKWLNAPDPSSNHNETSRKRAKGTGNWLVEDERYLEWKRGEVWKSPLWVSGRPGFGKSVLASTVIEDIQAETKSDGSLSLIYFYFDFRTPDKQNIRGLISSLVSQMAWTIDEVPPSLVKLYRDSQSDREPPLYALTEILRELFEMFNSQYQRTFIVIDALDECQQPEWYELTNVIKTVMDWNLPRIGLLLTSRRENIIAGQLQDIATEVDLESNIVSEDIAIYVDSVLESDPRFARWKNREEEQTEIRKTLTTRANGMFRWAYCQVESLSVCYARKDLLKTLRRLPKTLHDTYERILKNINDVHQDYAQAILQWLAFSYTRLSLQEIVEVLAIDNDSDPPQFDSRDRFTEPRDVLNVCASMITCTSSGYLELAHFSVKEYLMSDMAKSVKTYAVDEQLAHTFIARSCIGYLLHIPAPVNNETLVQFPLARYAAHYWIRHYCDGNYKVSQENILSLLRSNYGCIYFDLPADQTPDPIYYAASAGLTTIVQRLLSEGSNPNAKGGKYLTSLHTASYHGNLEIAQRLLRHGADINVLSDLYGTALQIASHEGHESIVHLLLESRADVNILGGYHRTAFRAAWLSGHYEIAQLLLLNGADVSIPEDFYGPALLKALHMDERFLHMLLGRKSDIPASHPSLTSALKTAVRNSDVKGTQLMLSLGANANTNAEAAYSGSVLQEASFFGNKTIVELLLNHGADINVSNGTLGTALQAAIALGHESVAQILLDSGADVKTKGCLSTRSPFTSSIKGQQPRAPDFVAEQKDYKADSLMAIGDHGRNENGRFSTPIQAASWSGHIALVEELLDRNADVNALGGVLGTALQAASIQGHLQVVELLIANGADVNCQGGMFHTALIASACGGHDAIVKLLLGRGSNPNIQFEGRTALLAASEKGYESIAKLLIDGGAEVNLQVIPYGTALQVANRHGQENVTRLLLANGADGKVSSDTRMLEFNIQELSELSDVGCFDECS